MPGTLGVVWIVRNRNVPAFAALEIGTGLIVAGWSLGRQWPHAAINAAAFAGFAAYWVAGRR